MRRNAALRNVVRLLSAAPHKTNWQNWVAGADALTAVKLTGSIAVAARALFTCVWVGNRCSFVGSGYCEASWDKDKAAVLLPATRDKPAF